MATCFFVSDLHGKIDRYKKLINAINDAKPAYVFIGGDFLPNLDNSKSGFINEYLIPAFTKLNEQLGRLYPTIFIIPGNDDPRTCITDLLYGETKTLWKYAHQRKFNLKTHMVYGYACVPPTPFLLKDWERYDVSRFVDPGCVSPEEGSFSQKDENINLKYSTIEKEITNLIGVDDLSNAIFLFHSPPYKSALDLTNRDGQMVDHAPIDPHVGSIAIERLIKRRQPWITLHGHIHESPRLTGKWLDKMGRTTLMSAAYDGPELALIEFNLSAPEQAQRQIL